LLNKLDPAALTKMAAYVSRETGDARKAVELLMKAVQVAEETSVPELPLGRPMWSTKATVKGKDMRH
jgi:Cdc6-like AAA superfamily ATPase